MVKAKITGLALAGVLALSGACVGIFARRAKTEADAASVSLTTSNAELVLPAGDSQAGYTAYEQYLSLTAPTDVALCEKYVAVADSDALYIYDRAKGSFFKTEIPEKGTDGTITKIGFSSDRLFVAVSASSNYFYEYNFSDKSFQKLNDINCSTFCISENTLYTASIGVTNTTIASYSIADLATNPTPKNLGTLDKKTTPSMTKLGSRLYCTIDDRAYHIDLSTDETFGDKTTSSYLSSGTSDTENVRSTCAHNGAFYYTADGGLYRAELSTTDDNAKKATCVLEGENFGALTSFGDSMYCIREKSVLRFDAEETNYKIADYEISSSSDSVGRLSGATDVVRAGSLVIIADTVNSRVTVYDGDTGTYSVLAPEEEKFSPTLVATDGTIVAAVSDNKVYVCNDPKKNSTFEESASLNNGTVKGIACVYGKVYYVTENNYHGVLDGTSVAKPSNGGTPTFMTSDLYGNLYVAYNDNSVRSFTEEEFLESGETGTTLDGITVPSNAKAMRADFKGNLYYLDESGNLCGKDGTLATIDATNFVYTDDESKSPVSFALGYEDDEVYFLFGDFIVKTKAGALGFPVFGRLSGATDVVRAGSFLVTADTGNNRVTVLDMQKRTFEVIQADFSPTLVATDGSVIAAASGNKVYVCEDPSKDPTFGKPVIADLGTIKGLACVHGKVYYITEYGYGKVEEVDKGLVSRLEDPLVALAADANGILYVVDTSGHVRYYYEDEFANPNIATGGDEGLTLHMPISSLRADCYGNLYYIHDNEIWKNDKLFFKIDNDSFVYSDENELISFALGFEDDEVFLLYGNHIVKTKHGGLNIPTKSKTVESLLRVDMLLPHEKGRRYYL